MYYLFKINKINKNIKMSYRTVHMALSYLCVKYIHMHRYIHIYVSRKNCEKMFKKINDSYHWEV